jgi:small-conductance mechanosensitive channel
MIRSDIRFRLDELFREHGIVIAFPQRDVHLHAKTPLVVTTRAAADTADEAP